MPKIIIFIIAAIAVFTFFFFPVTDFDIWWHLATGKLIIEDQAFPTREVFSYTAYGNLWNIDSWAFASLSYLGFKFFGIDGINTLKALLSFSVFFITAFYLNKKKLLNLFSLSFVVLAFFAIRENFSLRPQTFSYLFFVLFLIFLFEYKKKKSYKSIVRLSVLQFFWVNIHASFIYGIALSAFSFISDLIENRKLDKKNIVLVFSIAAASLFHVIYGYAYLFRIVEKFFLASQYQIQVREFLPPTPETFISLLGLVLLSIIPVIYFAFKKKQTGILLAVLFIAGLSLKASRFLPYLVLFLAVVAPFYFSMVKVPKKIKIPQDVLNTFFIIFVFILFLAAKNQSFGWGQGLEKFKYPVGAVEFIKNEKILEKSSGNIYNTYNFGGYLMWTIYPSKIFIDGRAFPYYGEIFENYWTNFEGGEVWKNTVEKYNISAALMTLPHTDGETVYNDSSRMFPKESWALIYYDDSSMVYARRMEELNDIIDKCEYKIINPQAMDFRYLQEKINSEEELNDAANELKRALEANPDSYRLHFTMSYLYNITGDRRGMLDEIKTTLKINPNFTAARKILDESY